MKFSASVIVLISCLSCIVHCEIKITDCGSEVGKFGKVSVSDCDETKSRCILKRGTNATVTIEFNINNDSENEVKAVCHGKVAGLLVPFKLPNDNGCVDSQLECPLVNETNYKYSASFPILKIYPKVDVEVKYELKNADGKDIVCVSIPVRIQ